MNPKSRNKKYKNKVTIETIDAITPSTMKNPFVNLIKNNIPSYEYLVERTTSVGSYRIRYSSNLDSGMLDMRTSDVIAFATHNSIVELNFNIQRQRLN